MAGKFLSRSLSFLPPISLRRLSTAVAAPDSASSAHFSVEEYLVHSCGLSKKDAESAAAASPALARLGSPDRPDAILGFLRDRGLAGDDIAAFVSRAPHLLAKSVGGQLAAKFDFLVGAGFSAVEVAALLQRSYLLNKVSLATIKKRVEFFRSILSNEAHMKSMIKRAVWALTGGTQVETRMAENIAKFREWGVPNERIQYFLVTYPRIFMLKSESIDNAASVAKVELGIDRNSKMFGRAVVIVSSFPEPSRKSKYEVFESFGWNKPDIVMCLGDTLLSLVWGSLLSLNVWSSSSTS